MDASLMNTSCNIPRSTCCYHQQDPSEAHEQVKSRLSSIKQETWRYENNSHMMKKK